MTEREGLSPAFVAAMERAQALRAGPEAAPPTRLFRRTSFGAAAAPMTAFHAYRILAWAFVGPVASS